MQSMACLYSQYIDSSADRTITPMISGIRIGDGGGYYHNGYNHQPVVVVGGGGANGGGHNNNNNLVGNPLANGGRIYQPHELELKMESADSLGGYCHQRSMGGGGGPGIGSMDSSPSSQSSSGSCGGRNRKCKEEKLCGVCGDKALGFNFDAISCESCKAFFRRNAPKGLSYFKCPYDEKCKMDLSNRRFCKRCRLKKCFEIGMRKEYILTEEEKAQKRLKIEENRYMKKLSTLTSSPNKSGGEEQELSSVTTDDDCSEGAVTCGAAAICPPVMLPPIAAAAPVAAPTAAPAPCIITSQTSYSPPAAILCPEDAAAIFDLHIAYRNSLEVSMDKDLSRDHANFSDLVNIAELSVRRVIAMAKQVPAFKALPQVEQIHLLKGGSIELLILRSVITFDKEKQHFLDPVDHEETKAMKLEQLEQAENGTGLFEDHMKFVRSLASDLNADETTLILLLVISLFSPDRENLEFKDLVAAEQEKFSSLLKSYLDATYAPAAARSVFPRLLMKLTDIRNLNEEHSQVLLKVNPEGIQPLMKEVLDLSC